jgi:hypothetical protein
LFLRAIADPPWRFVTYSDKGRGKCPDKYSRPMALAEIMAVPVGALFKRDAALAL